MNAAEKCGPVLQKGKGMIGISLAGGTAETLPDEARRAVREEPDLIEWRADLWEGDPREALQGQLPEILSGILGTVPLLYTYRTREEGGSGTLSGKEYEELLRLASSVPAVDLIDAEALRNGPEIKELIAELRQSGKQIIASSHDRACMPDERKLDARLKALMDSDADACKIACMAHTGEEAERFIAWSEKESRRIDRPLIAIAMGEEGVVSRLRAQETGMAMTFASLGKATAPGQIPIAELRKYRTEHTDAQREHKE